MLNYDGERSSIKFSLCGFHDDAIADGEYWRAERSYEVAARMLSATAIPICSKNDGLRSCNSGLE